MKQLKMEYFSIDDDKKLPFIIKLKLSHQSLKITYDKTTINFDLPSDYSRILGELEKIAKQIKISFTAFEYFPFRQELRVEGKILKINLIHNQILMYVSISKEGINKLDLYKIIWPIDKEYFINKLDTHITNLKHLLKTEANLKVNFISSGGSLKMLE